MSDRLTTVVVVSYWSESTIGGCLDALLASTPPVDVVVVDNGSGDGTRASVRRRSSAGASIRLVENDDNPGFGAACNQGAGYACGDFILFLNPDAFVSQDSIARLRAAFDAHARAGLVGCRVVDSSGEASGPQRRREPTWRRSLSTTIGLARWERRWPWAEGVEVRSSIPVVGAGGRDERVEAVNGAAMMLPVGLFSAIGGFDTGFRLHAEDLDLCRRVRDAGYDVMFVADATIVHVGKVSSRRRPLWVEWQKTRSLWRYFRKHDPARNNLAIRFVVVAGLALRYICRLSVLLLRR